LTLSPRRSSFIDRKDLCIHIDAEQHKKKLIFISSWAFIFFSSTLVSSEYKISSFCRFLVCNTLLVFGVNIEAKIYWTNGEPAIYFAREAKEKSNVQVLIS
jgi:hypothetical protein